LKYEAADFHAEEPTSLPVLGKSAGELPQRLLPQESLPRLPSCEDSGKLGRPEGVAMSLIAGMIHCVS